MLAACSLSAMIHSDLERASSPRSVRLNQVAVKEHRLVADSHFNRPRRPEQVRHSSRNFRRLIMAEALQFAEITLMENDDFSRVPR